MLILAWILTLFTIGFSAAIIALIVAVISYVVGKLFEAARRTK